MRIRILKFETLIKSIAKLNIIENSIHIYDSIFII